MYAGVIGIGCTIGIRKMAPISHPISRQSVDRSAWKIKPAAYCDEQHIIQFWDDILRFIATIKLKETTASDIFRRLNSYLFSATPFDGDDGRQHYH